MRLTGIVNGSITFGDRPSWFGEIFDLTATVETPGVSNWTNISAAAAGSFTNLGAAAAEGWQNIDAASASAWANV